MRATDLLDRKLSGGEKRSKEAHVKKLKKHKGDFEKRYGDDAESVMYAVATKRAKGEGVEESPVGPHGEFINDQFNNHKLEVAKWLMKQDKHSQLEEIEHLLDKAYPNGSDDRFYKEWEDVVGTNPLPWQSTGVNPPRKEGIEDIAKAHTKKHTLPRVDTDRYQERDGLEGPIATRSGKVVYYDNKEGKYYDPDTDMYIDHEDMKALTAVREEHLNEWVWVLPALATAARVGGPALLKLLKHGAKKVAPVAGTTTRTIIKNPGTTLKWAGAGYIFKSIHDVVSMVKDYVGDLMDDETIGTFSKVIWKYKLPAAAVIAVLYGGKKLKDYMAGEEEQQGNTTINNYYNNQPEPATEDGFDAEGQHGKALMQLYKDNEHNNYHSENNLLLAKAFGTPKEVNMVELIIKKNQKQGYTSPEDNEWMYLNINKKYYKELVKGSLGEAFKENNSPGARRDARLKRKNAYLQKTMAKYRQASKMGMDPARVNQRRNTPTLTKSESIFDE